jgi:hypothetical protein
VLNEAMTLKLQMVGLHASRLRPSGAIYNLQPHLPCFLNQNHFNHIFPNVETKERKK